MGFEMIIVQPKMQAHMTGVLIKAEKYDLSGRFADQDGTGKVLLQS
jgi:hypothetical protein